MHTTISNNTISATEKNQDLENLINSPQTIEEEVNPHIGYDYFIPGHVSSLDISRDIKFLYALIRNLCNGNHIKKWKGSTWVKNKFLAEKMEVTERCIQKWIKVLVNEGVIITEIFNLNENGVKRCIWLSEEYARFQKFTSHERPFGGPRTAVQVAPNDGSCSIYKDKERKEKERKKKSVGTHPSFLSIAKPKEEKKLFGENVKLTENEYQKLLQTDGEEKLKWKIGFLDMKIASLTGYDKKYKSHYHVLLPNNFPEKEYLKAHASNNSYNDVAKFNYDKALAEKIYERCKRRPQNDVNFGYNYLEFYNGQITLRLEFGTKDFREKALQQLIIRKISLQGL